MLKPITVSIALLLTAGSWAQEPLKQFTQLPQSFTGIDFRNTITEDANMFYYKYEYLYVGAGVCVGDINNDGLQDLYFSSTQGINRLYLNRGNLRFQDITQSAGVGGGPGFKTGVNMIDINNDGFLDILVSKSGPGDPANRTKVLYINNGNNTFTDQASAYGLDDASYTTQSYFFDFDLDGDKDVFFVNHPIDFTYATLIPAKMVNGKMVLAEDTTTKYISNRLFENRNGKFVDITRQAGLVSHAFGLSASIADFNRDGRPDIYVANDFNKPDFLYINEGNGKFSEQLSRYIDKISLSSMGSDINDLNNDGHEDLFVADMAIEDPVRQKQLFVQNLNYDKFQLLLRFNLFYQYPRNVLQLNNGNGSFSEIAYYSGIAQTDWSWAPLIADYDNDGWKDLFVSNGLKRDISDWDYKVFVLDSIKNLMARGIAVNLEDWFKLIPEVRIPNYFYRNTGKLTFDNMSERWVNQQPSFSSGAVYADLDNDGDLDIVTNNIDDPAFVYRNNASQNGSSSYLRFRVLNKKGSNEEVYGTIIRIYDQEGNMQLNRFDPQRGYMGSNEHFVHFGLGQNKGPFRVSFEFPGKRFLTISDLAANQVYNVYASEAKEGEETTISTTIFQSPKEDFFWSSHRENEFIDFKREPLIPYMCSRKGPYFTMADVNGDGRQDIFVGGATGEPGRLHLQTSAGFYHLVKTPAFETDRAHEDNGAIFFDADGDGDQDLYVVSGGASFEKNDLLYQDRLYINDGRGNFTRSRTALPKETSNGSVVLPLQASGNNINYLFVGGGVYPGKFPMNDPHYLYVKEKTGWKPVYPQPIIEGIINSAVSADLDGAGDKELVVAGEWAGPQIFTWQGGTWNKMISQVLYNDTVLSLDELSGWFNVIKAADLDGDGDQDLVLGNRGLNSRITASPSEPCLVYAKDFDNNGSYDAVLGFYIQGKPYPMYHRDQLVDQMPFMRKRFLRYRHFAGATMDDLFTPAQKQGMAVYKTSIFESGILFNEGNNNYRFSALPFQAQFSTVNDIIIHDFTGDGNVDMLLAGNSSDPDVSTGNYDATPVLLLKGNGKGNFEAMDLTKTGVNINGEVRRIIHEPEKGRVIFLRNNDSAISFIYETAFQAGQGK